MDKTNSSAFAERKGTLVYPDLNSFVIKKIFKEKTLERSSKKPELPEYSTDEVEKIKIKAKKSSRIGKYPCGEVIN